MSECLNALQASGHIAGLILAVLLCIAAVVLSCLSISGTWIVLAAAGLLAFLIEAPFPGIWTLVIFFVVCIAVEVVEFLAGYWGITNKGGSKLAGLMAVLGGFIGMFVGAIIPIPILGPIIGMLAGSFGFAFLVERDRLKKDSHAADIAMGAVISRIAVILMKVCVTFGMIIALILGLIFGNGQ